MFGSMEMDFGAQKEDTNFQYKNSKRKLFLYAHTHTMFWYVEKKTWGRHIKFIFAGLMNNEHCWSLFPDDYFSDFLGIDHEKSYFGVRLHLLSLNSWVLKKGGWRKK